MNEHEYLNALSRYQAASQSLSQEHKPILECVRQRIDEFHRVQHLGDHGGQLQAWNNLITDLEYLEHRMQSPPATCTCEEDQDDWNAVIGFGIALFAGLSVGVVMLASFLIR